MSALPNIFYSEFQIFTYTPEHKNGLPSVVLDPTKETHYSYAVIHEGYHSFSRKAIPITGKMCVADVLKRVVIPCVIPVGAEYYYNPSRGEYVSSTILFNVTLDSVP